MIKMYYSEGITFHTSTTSYSAGDVYPMAGTERMRITFGGNVLIGTTNNLGSELNVNSTIRVGVAFASAASIVFGDSGTPYWNVGRPASSGNFSISSYALTALTIQPTTGNVGIGTPSPLSRLSVIGDATNNEGLVNINNSKSAGGVYFPALKVRNGEGNHSYGIVSDFSTGSTGGDRPSILFYSNVSNHSWAIGQVTAAWGVADSFGIGYRASNSPSTFNAWPTNYFAITTSGNVLIGTTTAPTPVAGVSFPLTVASSAATRIRIDSTNASPNSGVGLYANGVQKFSFAMYGATSDFTIYNDALLAPALVVKGNNSNVLIGTTTSTGAKLEINGDIRTGALGGGYVSGFWKMGRALLGTQPTETYQIIVEINGDLFAIGAAQL